MLNKCLRTGRNEINNSYQLIIFTLVMFFVFNFVHAQNQKYEQLLSLFPSVSLPLEYGNAFPGKEMVNSNTWVGSEITFEQIIIANDSLMNDSLNIGMYKQDSLFLRVNGNYAVGKFNLGNRIYGLIIYSYSYSDSLKIREFVLLTFSEFSGKIIGEYLLASDNENKSEESDFTCTPLHSQIDKDLNIVSWKGCGNKGESYSKDSKRATIDSTGVITERW